jgi:hypothetical protein
MSNIAQVYVKKYKVNIRIPSHSLSPSLSKWVLRIPAWDHPEDRPGQGSHLQSDSWHAPDR